MRGIRLFLPYQEAIGLFSVKQKFSRQASKYFLTDLNEGRRQHKYRHEGRIVWRNVWKYQVLRW